MENKSLNETTLRPLGALESYSWQIDATCPKHFTVSAEINSFTRIEDWSSALKKVQSRHPLINSRIDATSDNRLYFFHDRTVEISLRVSRLNKISSIENEIKREFSAPIWTGDMALLKATLLYSEECCVIIMTAHHAIADGRSLAHFIHDLLETLAGKNLPELPLLPPIEDLCKLDEESVGNIKTPDFSEEPVPYTERSLANLQIFRQRLSPELSGRIRQRAKKENTTVHGALSAAFTLALYQSSAWHGRPVRICTPIDARKYSASDYSLSFQALFPTYSYDASNAEDFWSIARKVTEDLNRYREKHGVVEWINLVGPAMKSNGLNGMIQFDREICAPDILISNLGVLPFSQKYGELTLESLWGPNVLVGTQDEQTIGVATINDAIHLIHTSYNSAPGFLENAINILSSVTKSTYLN
ncbi:condensation domain-containing protein [Dickeya ananatis]|uniref:condensation domain-containing protein n=1 Tax=Dickeya ananatis TaxID=3061286 RepID=UPI00388DA1A4